MGRKEGFKDHSYRIPYSLYETSLARAEERGMRFARYGRAAVILHNYTTIQGFNSVNTRLLLPQRYPSALRTPDFPDLVVPKIGPYVPKGLSISLPEPHGALVEKYAALDDITPSDRFGQALRLANFIVEHYRASEQVTFQHNDQLLTVIDALKQQ